MKKLYLFSFVFIFFLQTSYAQTDFRFADSSAVWVQCTAHCDEGPYGVNCDISTDTFRVAGDTIINGISYQKIIPSNVWWHGISSAQFHLLRKDSTGKVFEYNTDFVLSNSERLIYDFGLNQGDSFTVHFPPHIHGWAGNDTTWVYSDSIRFVVDTVDFIFIGTSKKRMYLRNITDYYNYRYTYDTVIDGIGCFRSAFVSPYIHEYSYIPGASFSLLNYTENNTAFPFKLSCYTSVGINETELNNIKIFPNPTTDFINVNEVAQATSFQLSDLYGRTVLSVELVKGTNSIDVQNLSNGLYVFSIADGKKTGKIVINQF